MGPDWSNIVKNPPGLVKTVVVQSGPHLLGAPPRPPPCSARLPRNWRHLWRPPPPPPPPPAAAAPACESKASLRRTEVYCTCGRISLYSGRDCVKSLRSSYMRSYPQTRQITGRGALYKARATARRLTFENLKLHVRLTFGDPSATAGCCRACHARMLEGFGPSKGNGTKHPLLRKFKVIQISHKSICVL